MPRTAALGSLDPNCPDAPPRHGALEASHLPSPTDTNAGDFAASARRAPLQRSAPDYFKAHTAGCPVATRCRPIHICRRFEWAFCRQEVAATQPRAEIGRNGGHRARGRGQTDRPRRAADWHTVRTHPRRHARHGRAGTGSINEKPQQSLVTATAPWLQRRLPLAPLNSATASKSETTFPGGTSGRMLWMLLNT